MEHARDSPLLYICFTLSVLRCSGAHHDFDGPCVGSKGICFGPFAKLGPGFVSIHGVLHRFPVFMPFDARAGKVK